MDDRSSLAATVHKSRDGGARLLVTLVILQHVYKRAYRVRVHNNDHMIGTDNFFVITRHTIQSFVVVLQNIFLTYYYLLLFRIY